MSDYIRINKNHIFIENNHIKLLQCFEISLEYQLSGLPINEGLIMKHVIIQAPAINSGFYQVIKLDINAYVSAAGYVVGTYEIVFPKLTKTAADRVLNILKGAK